MAGLQFWKKKYIEEHDLDKRQHRSATSSAFPLQWIFICHFRSRKIPVPVRNCWALLWPVAGAMNSNAAFQSETGILMSRPCRQTDMVVFKETRAFLCFSVVGQWRSESSDRIVSNGGGQGSLPSPDRPGPSDQPAIKLGESIFSRMSKVMDQVIHFLCCCIC